MMYGYLFLALTIISETAAIIFMKLSNGFANKFYAGIAFVGFALCYIFLTLALKYLPAGIANATWAGISTLLITLFGIIIFKEHLNTAQYFFMALIIIGLAGLNYFEKTV